MRTDGPARAGQLSPLARAGFVAVCAAALIVSAAAQTPVPAPAVTEGNFTVHNYTFRSGESMPDVRLHYRTLGVPRRDAR